ncbi:hypothetical protein GCM10010912_27970 [Paenibacillus albidus]|uniref:DinB-like domain-containing protein n=1 Tax=Paenibacillus albidus TaxID=2041023 RepID=A0A917CCW8_9BACL|nr:DinB family protein [Paenibacillus albidus]GGF81275.1 hypothetical protein GCM10010912_27970 [Paenibacillus albidus]
MSKLHLIEDYLNTHRQLVEALDGLSAEALKWKAKPGSWSITEVVAHLADHSIVVSFRIRDILAGTTVQLPAFNQDAWVSGQHANEGEVAESLALFYSLLQYNARLFERLGEEEWAKSGVNAKGETIHITDIIRSFAAHVQTHLAQIERIQTGAKAVLPA